MLDREQAGSESRSYPTDGSLQLRGIRNVLKTGHCAPAVMRTLGEITGAEADPLVKLTSGLGGGIGSIRSECGCVTSPIIMLGLEHGSDLGSDDLPKVISLGRRYIDRFRELNKGIKCREILKNERNILPCLGAIRRAPVIFKGLANGLGEAADVESGMTGETKEAYELMLRTFRQHNFHCAHEVLSGLEEARYVDEELLRGSWGFIGGTLLKGMTCGALTAGVLAIGMNFGAYRDSGWRVFKMTLRMFAGADAESDHINAFNRALNISNELASGFEREFGSTNCYDILKADFSTLEGVNRYVSEGLIDKCREITGSVVRRTRRLVEEHGGRP